MSVKGYAAVAHDKPLEPFSFDRRELRNDDVAMDILYSGVCHSDLHHSKNDWGKAQYPVVPGHEIVGKVTSVGKDVSKFKVGDIVGVGVMVDSCRECSTCQDNQEQLCLKGYTATYNHKDRHDGTTTYGGYSKSIITADHFVYKIPEGVELKTAPPILCAGITTWSPLRRWNVQAGDHVAVMGLGGLGHMGVKLAKGLGAKVTLFTRSKGKEADAIRLGVDEIIYTTDPEQMKNVQSKFKVILDTVPYDHDFMPYINALAPSGAIAILGYFGPTTFDTSAIIRSNKSIIGSLIGGVAETQELLEFCAKHKIQPDCEIIKMDYINEAYDRMLKSDIKYRFVIDMTEF